jgi:hypothetical protein
MTFGPCPTVRVRSDESPDGYVVINESDMTDEHVLWQEPKNEKKPEPTKSQRG